MQKERVLLLFNRKERREEQERVGERKRKKERDSVFIWKAKENQHQAGKKETREKSSTRQVWVVTDP